MIGLIIYTAIIDGDLLRLRALKSVTLGQIKLSKEAIHQQRWVFPIYLRKLRSVIRGRVKLYPFYGKFSPSTSPGAMLCHV